MELLGIIIAGIGAVLVARVSYQVLIRCIPADGELMTVRQRYKAAALTGYLSDPNCTTNRKGLAQACAEYADAMLAEDAEFAAKRLKDS